MSRLYKKDVTDEEIRIAMEPVYQEISKFLVQRIKPMKENSVQERPKQKDKQKSNLRNAQEKQKNPVTISHEEREYLKSILEFPNLSVTARGEKLFGFSADKRTRIKKALLEKKLILEFSVDLGSGFGGRVKLLKLTDEGYKFLGLKPPEQPRFSKRGSLEHMWWQERIAQDYNERGYQAVVEKELNGKCADTGVSKGDEIVAVEIELTPKNAITNFKENCDAGFSRTIIACKNARVKKTTEGKIASFIESNPGYANKAKIILLSEYPFLKKLSSEIRG